MNGPQDPAVPRGPLDAVFDALLARPFERLIVGHGTPVETDARAALQAALAWL